MSTDGTEAGLPSLLVQAARSAAEADGLANTVGGINDVISTSSGDTAVALASIGSEKKDPAVLAMERARNAIAGVENVPAVKASPTAGTAAHILASSAPASLRKASVSQAPTGGGSGKKKGPPLRRGKWTPEEEAYANRLIQEFKAGLLPLTDGTTLRTFLSKLLNCDPMRISKKFVGSNCIGKQVFRRRTADINRLTPEQIQQSRAELSELERRFLERVAQTNRVKSSGVGAGNTSTASAVAAAGIDKVKDDVDNSPPSPPWLKPPLGYKQGNGAVMASAALAGHGSNNRAAAAAGRALLQGMGSSDLKAALERKSSNPSLSSRESAGLLAMANAHRRTSGQSLLNSLDSRGSATNLLAAAAAAGRGSGGTGLSGSAMAQIARNASAARLAGLSASGSSMNNLLLKSGLSRDQLTQIAREGGMSSASLSNMMDRQSSFDALMSLDLQSLQSIDNLANLIQSGSTLPGQVPQSGMRNWSADTTLGGASSSSNLVNSASESTGDFADLATRKLASVGRMESLLRSLSSQNMKKSSSSSGTGGGSNANFNNLLQSMQSNLSNLAGSGSSSNNLLGSTSNSSTLSLANMLRADSSTGLTALRMQDGLDQRNSSVDDFLSLVAAGDIPHQDPSLLNVPLMQQQQQEGQSGSQSAASLIAQQQLLAQAVGGSSRSALANALASGNSGSLNTLRSSSAASLLAGRGNGSAASLLAQNAALSGLGGSSAALKRKLFDLDGTLDSQGSTKR